MTQNTLGDEALAARIKASCMHGDYEVAHCEADDLMIEELRALGYHKAVEAWSKVGKWYA